MRDLGAHLFVPVSEHTLLFTSFRSTPFPLSEFLVEAFRGTFYWRRFRWKYRVLACYSTL